MIHVNLDTKRLRARLVELKMKAYSRQVANQRVGNMLEFVMKQALSSEGDSRYMHTRKYKKHAGLTKAMRGYEPHSVGISSGNMLNSISSSFDSDEASAGTNSNVACYFHNAWEQGVTDNMQKFFAWKGVGISGGTVLKSPARALVAKPTKKLSNALIKIYTEHLEL